MRQASGSRSCAIARRLRAPTDDPHLYQSGIQHRTGNAISAPASMPCTPNSASCRSPGYSRARQWASTAAPSTTWWWCRYRAAPGDPVPAAARHGVRSRPRAGCQEVRPAHPGSDLLLYGELVCETPLVPPRAARSHQRLRAWLLAELAPTFRHPIDGRTIGELWAGYDKASQRLDPIPFHWKAGELQHH